MSWILGVVGLVHGFIAGITVTLSLDTRNWKSRKRLLLQAIVWWASTAAALGITNYHYGTWAFYPCTLIAFGSTAVVAFLGRSRPVVRRAIELQRWPMQRVFESPIMKGLGVILCVAAAIVALWSAFMTVTVLTCLGALMWGGADVYAGFREVAASFREGSIDEEVELDKKNAGEA